MNVRRATIDDLARVLEISNWAAMHTPANFAVEPEALDVWREAFVETHESHPWLVACDDHHSPRGVVGFAKASPHRGRCAYHWSVEVTVYVHPDHHGRGIGAALYGTLIPLLRHQGFHTAIAGITRPNEASERLHRRFGFKSVGVFEQIGWKFERWHDVGYWQARLTEGDASMTRPPDPLRSVSEAWAEMSSTPGD